MHGGFGRTFQCTYVLTYVCVCVGWGHHMICRKRYHFVMPAWRAGARMAHGGGDSDGGGGCGEEREVGSGNYYSCNVISKASGSDKLQSQQQLMHAVVHSNGFGHLLSVNGIAGGSEVVSGHQILDLWNRLCSALNLRYYVNAIYILDLDDFISLIYFFIQKGEFDGYGEEGGDELEVGSWDRVWRDVVWKLGV